MRKVLRNNDALTYWNKRWSDFPEDEKSFQNMNIYPIKFVTPYITKEKRTLDVGCGLGRIVKHYHYQGYDISGCDYSSVAVKKLNLNSPELRISEGDVTNLKYRNDAFDLILAFGVFHSIEDLNAINKGITEVIRCLTVNGNFVVSVRVDNMESRLIDNITEKRGKKGSQFHKWCFSEREFAEMLTKNFLFINKVDLFTNVPFLHKFRIFRKNNKFDEKEARSTGFQLNFIGNTLYKLLKFSFPHSFGTTLVFSTTKRKSLKLLEKHRAE